jgi:luciferase family oxidoreductase group 1
MRFPLGILDQSPIVAGATPADAVRATIALAKRADALGYKRYWLAEHHAMRGLADASPEILLGRLTAETSRIRLGTGGIMLPHYSAFKVAETFRMLETLAPGRIDLGMGRAPGGTRLISAALESRDPGLFPEQIADVAGFLAGTTPEGHDFAALPAMPSGETSPELWILGSSEYGALLAAKMGLPYAYAHFISSSGSDVTQMYRARFRPSPRYPKPRVIVALAALVAPSDEEAERLALPVTLWRMLLLRGRNGPLPTVEQAEAYPWTPLERHEIARTRRMIAGSPASVRPKIESLVDDHGADEALVVTIAPDYASRERSYELLADAFSIRSLAA